MGKAIAEVYFALRGTREGRYGCLPVGSTAKLIGCSCGIPCLHALEYTPDPTHVVDWCELVVDADGTFKEG